MSKDNLVNKLKKGFYTGLTASALGLASLAGCDSGPLSPDEMKLNAKFKITEFRYENLNPNTGNTERVTLADTFPGIGNHLTFAFNKNRSFDWSGKLAFNIWPGLSATPTGTVYYLLKGDSCRSVKDCDPAKGLGAYVFETQSTLVLNTGLRGNFLNDYKWYLYTDPKKGMSLLTQELGGFTEFRLRLDQCGQNLPISC